MDSEEGKVSGLGYIHFFGGSGCLCFEGYGGYELVLELCGGAELCEWRCDWFSKGRDWGVGFSWR